MKHVTLPASLIIGTIFLWSGAYAQNIIQVTEGENKIDDAIFEAQPGDIIELVTNGGVYHEFFSIVIDMPLEIRAAEHLITKPVIISDEPSRMIDVRDDFTIRGIILDGAPGAEPSSFGIRTASDASQVKEGYDLTVDDCVFINLETGIRGDTDTFAGTVTITNSHFQDMTGRGIRFRDPAPPPRPRRSASPWPRRERRQAR
jgi:hypothetical protein